MILQKKRLQEGASKKEKKSRCPLSWPSLVPTRNWKRNAAHRRLHAKHQRAFSKVARARLDCRSFPARARWFRPCTPSSKHIRRRRRAPLLAARHPCYMLELTPCLTYCTASGHPCQKQPPLLPLDLASLLAHRLGRSQRTARYAFGCLCFLSPWHAHQPRRPSSHMIPSSVRLPASFQIHCPLCNHVIASPAGQPNRLQVPSRRAVFCLWFWCVSFSQLAVHTHTEYCHLSCCLPFSAPVAVSACLALWPGTPAVSFLSSFLFHFPCFSVFSLTAATCHLVYSGLDAVLFCSRQRAAALSYLPAYSLSSCPCLLFSLHKYRPPPSQPPATLLVEQAPFFLRHSEANHSDLFWLPLGSPLVSHPSLPPADQQLQNRSFVAYPPRPRVLSLVSTAAHKRREGEQHLALARLAMPNANR